MASIKDLRKRIGTREEHAADDARHEDGLGREAAPCAGCDPAISGLTRSGSASLIQLMARAVGQAAVESPLARRREREPKAQESFFWFVVTSDRGLCGGFNGNIIKTAQRWIAANAERIRIDRARASWVARATSSSRRKKVTSRHVLRGARRQGRPSPRPRSSRNT